MKGYCFPFFFWPRDASLNFHRAASVLSTNEISESDGESMSEILEIIMIVSFGASWPMNVMKSWRSRTTKGKSLAFLCLIFFGYIAGIAGKLCNAAYMAEFASKWYVLFFYVLNLLMVGADLCLYYRNYLLDKKSGLR